MRFRSLLAIFAILSPVVASAAMFTPITPPVTPVLPLRSLPLTTGVSSAGTSAVRATVSSAPVTPGIRVPSGVRPGIAPLLPTITITGTLTCPALSSTKIALPKPPYSATYDDCALRGKSAAIEAYLTALEELANECTARIEDAWAQVQSRRSSLDNQIDNLSPPPSSSSAGGFTLPSIPPICGLPGASFGPSEPLEGMDPDGTYYSHWLRRIQERVVKYCRLVDELGESLVTACTEMKDEVQCLMDSGQGVSDGRKTAFHARVTGAMNAAEIRREYVDFFLISALQTYGWGNFREYFHEEYIQCTGGSAMLKNIKIPMLIEKMGLGTAALPSVGKTSSKAGVRGTRREDVSPDIRFQASSARNRRPARRSIRSRSQASRAFMQPLRMTPRNVSSAAPR